VPARLRLQRDGLEKVIVHKTTESDDRSTPYQTLPPLRCGLALDRMDLSSQSPHRTAALKKEKVPPAPSADDSAGTATLGLRAAWFPGSSGHA